eukprot:7554822-Prorocentrum_lima.AAC.1
MDSLSERDWVNGAEDNQLQSLEIIPFPVVAVVALALRHLVPVLLEALLRVVGFAGNFLEFFDLLHQ